MSSISPKKRLRYYAEKWYKYEFSSGHALTWIFIVFLTVVQGFLVIAFLAEQGSGSVAEIANLYKYIIFFAIAILLGVQVVVAAIIIEVWHYTTGLSDDMIEEMEEVIA